MKRALFVAAVMIPLAASAGSALAQSEEPRYLRLPHRFQIYLEGGGALPTRPGITGDMWNAGFVFGIGAGVSIFPWLEVTGGFATMSFGLNRIDSKSLLGYQGVKEVEGGTISTTIVSGTARFIGVPKSRTNPFVEATLGYYQTSAEDVEIEEELRNSMDDAKGLSVAPSAGIQYALGDYWSAYARYTYIVNLSDTFAPGTLLQPAGGQREVEEGNQVSQTIIVGIMLRF